MTGKPSEMRIFVYFDSSSEQNHKVNISESIISFFVGVVLYTRTMFVFFGLLEYWQTHGLPIFELFRRSPTFFSEESGEIGLSLLTRSRPVNMRCDYEQTRKSWLLVKQMYTASSEARMDSKAPGQNKSFRTIGKLYPLFHFVLFQTFLKILSDHIFR
jgi:hypothetical protein